MTRFAVAWVGHLALIGTFFWWTGIADDTGAKLALSIAVAIGWIVALIALERWLFRRRSINWQWAVALLAVSIAALLLVRWVPPVTGLPLQLMSFLLRFGLAWTALNWVWVFAGQSVAPPPEHHIAPVAGD